MCLRLEYCGKGSMLVRKLILGGMDDVFWV